MFEGVKQQKVSDFHLFKDEELKGTEFMGTMVFDNQYELSIVRHSGSYGGNMGKFEIMLSRSGNPTSLPPITEEYDTIKGFLTYEQVVEIIETVEDLPGTV